MKKILIAIACQMSFGMLAHAQPVPPPDGYYRHHHNRDYYRPGLHNDRYPPHLYYWHPQHGRYYARYYVATYRYARCQDGAVQRARPSACRNHGGVLYYY